MVATNSNDKTASGAEIKIKVRKGKFGRPGDGMVGVCASDSPHSETSFKNLSNLIRPLKKTKKVDEEKNKEIDKENSDPQGNIRLISPGGHDYSPQMTIGNTIIAKRRDPSSPTSGKIASKNLPLCDFNESTVKKKLNFDSLIEQPFPSIEAVEAESGIPWDFFQLPQEKVISYSIDLSPTNIIKKGKRQPSGEQIFGLSANEIAPRLGLPEVNEEILQKYEWLHLCAFRWTRTEGQVKKNLILGTFNCNTLMMFIEEKVNKLVVEQKKKVSIKVEAIIDCSTAETKKYHLAKEVNYTVIVEGYAQPILINFNPQHHKRPCYNDEAAIEAVFKVEELREQNKAEEKSSSSRCSM